MDLPHIDHETYWRDLHGAGMDRWSPALRRIQACHDLDMDGVQRSPLGRNIVLVADAWVVKLIPPFWLAMGERERTALEEVHGRLSVVTPVLRAAGALDAWTYIVMDRVPGTCVGRRGEIGSPARRTWVARWQGQLIREIAALEPTESLRWDWEVVLQEQEQEQELEPSLASLPRSLARTAVAYVQDAGNLAEGNVRLHGDVASINLLETPSGELALVDWSDAAVGPSDHEFISPLMHQFRGDPDELESFWHGHGPVPGSARTRHRIMARSILKYARLLPRYLDDLPGAMPSSWDEAARRFTRLA